MNGSAIFLPFFGIMLLTLAVWITMYVRRIAYLRRNRVDLRTVDTPDKAAHAIPARVQLAACNLQNLFELPVIFYAVCLYLYVTDTVDSAFVYAGWWFLAFRVLHSLIYCTYNKVEHRFAAYFVSSLALWAMVLRASIGIFFGPGHS